MVLPWRHWVSIPGKIDTAAEVSDDGMDIIILTIDILWCWQSNLYFIGEFELWATHFFKWNTRNWWNIWKEILCTYKTWFQIKSHLWKVTYWANIFCYLVWQIQDIQDNNCCYCLFLLCKHWKLNLSHYHVLITQLLINIE